MGKKSLDILNQAGNSLLAYSQHPVKAMEREFQSAYLNGLAVVMDADEKIRAGEQENIKRLLIAFDMPEEKLEDIIAFGKTADKDAMVEILTILQGAEDIRYVFLLDCLSLAHADNELHEDETQTIKTFSEFIKVSSAQLKLIEHLEQIVRTKDHKALYRFFLQKYDLDLTVFKYLLDFYKVDIEQVKRKERKRLKKLLGMEFRTIKNSYTPAYGYGYTFAHGLTDDNKDRSALVSQRPLQLSQLAIILQEKFEQKIIRVEDSWVVEICSDKIILSLKHSKLKYGEGQFSFKTNTHATGLTRYGVHMLSNVISEATNLKVSPISMEIGFGNNDQVESSRFSFEPIEYVEVHNDSYSVNIRPWINDGKTFEVKSTMIWKEGYTDAATTFRFMQIAENLKSIPEKTIAKGQERNPRTGERR